MTEREMFEVWYKSKEYSEKPTLLQSGKYSGWIKQELWEAWQASASREGYKLVSVKCTNDMAYAAKVVDGRLSAFKYGDVWKAMIGVVE